MKLYRFVLSFLLIVGYLQADVHSNEAKTELTGELYGSKGNQEARIDALIQKIGSIGFSTVAANKHIEVHYLNKFKEKNVEMISFFDIVNKKKMRPLLLKNPDFGAYAPFNFLVYKTLDTKEDNNTWYGHLAPDTMLNIIGEKDPATRDQFKAMVQGFDDLVVKEMQPTMTKKFVHSKPLPEHGLTKMVMKFDAPDDMEEFIEDFVMKHDGAFSKHDFIIAGFVDYKFEYSDMDLDFDKYDAYWVSLLCHFKFSNSIFNRGIPEAGMFAPCSIYFYIPKGKNELHVGYASVDNWINALNFKDQKTIDYMRAIDAEVIETFRELGFELEAQGAKVPEVMSLDEENRQLKAKVKALEAQIEAMKKGETTVETRPQAAAVKAVPQKVFRGAKLQIGAKAPKKLSTYYAAKYQTVDALKAKLEANGFTVLAVTPILAGKTVVTITNEELQKTNTFLATLHVLVNEGNEIRVQNPSYFGAAYLQDKYKYGQFVKTLEALQAALGDMYEVKEQYELADLPKYQFMFGMPYLNDTITVAKGDNLAAKVTGKDAVKYVAYTLKLPNGDMIVGHKLRNRTNKFLLKVNAARDADILPYESMIKGKKAVMLDPKYYLALSLPLLSMSDFMKIASAPGEIEKDVKRAYK
ncbi:hypothetical protein [Sulfurovum sp.]|uniref:hypothetical protein n=1 Tax=Sulfurovum sp. TaxID=1969726 RepID=UPI0025EFFDC6|nr:hypothetical protein [Sulfurovum sp.]